MVLQPHEFLFPFRPVSRTCISQELGVLTYQTLINCERFLMTSDKNRDCALAVGSAVVIRIAHDTDIRQSLFESIGLALIDTIGPALSYA